ncbi:MAG: glycosyltransferase family 39 protein [Anaerolineales bacterium]
MPRRNWISWLFAALPASLGIFGIILALLPYEILKPFTGLLMPDGNFNSLKPWNAEVFKVLFGLGGLVFLGLAVLTGLRRWKLFGPFFKQLWADTGHFFASLRPQKDELGFLAAVLVIMVLAVIYRLEYIYSSLHHDEAYTYVAFAHSLFAAATDYHLPNNHVFHSILVHLSTRIFGIQPWAVRLPAFTAGVLLVPAVYWLAKRLYDRWTALGAALLVAWLPILINYSTNARGYTLVALFTLLTLTLGSIVRKQKNLLAWMLISLFSALGLYTVPVMLFPFGILFAWLFFGNQVEGPGPYRSKLDFLRYWVAAGVGTVILTMLFYTPILIFTGPEKVFVNGFVAPLPWADLLETLSHRFTETWVEWTSGVPLIMAIFLAAGWTLSLIFHRRLSTTRVPLQLVAVLWIAALIIIQRPNAWAKVWLFLLPLMLLWAAAGTVGLLEKVRLKFLRGLPLAVIVVGLALLAGIQHAAWLAPQLPELWAGRGGEEKAVLFVQGQLQDDDLIIVAPPDDAAVWYYSELHGIMNTHFDPLIAFDRALVLVDPVEGQTPASVLEERGSNPAQVDVESCHLLETFDKILVFECSRK